MNYSSLKIFRIIAFLEGISYIALLFIGVPLKYLLHNDILVKMMGMPHGIFFIAYIIFCLIVKLLSKSRAESPPKDIVPFFIHRLLFAIFQDENKNWNQKTTFIILIASMIPFGTFYIDKKYLR
ncbi:MAG: hypothetical protein CMD23_04100 [Flavobacteriales bacterium]|nr:hypothetical protein [Flavobacteriales bacterium]|tara:strand:- start:1137 stop:1508 length:372 start_codon:yes stop_codon:yes gene_type:complete